MTLRRIAGWSVMILCVALTAAAFVASAMTGTTLMTGSTLTEPLLALAVLLLGFVVGGIVILKQPENRLGIVLAVAGIGGALSGIGAGLGSGDSAAIGNDFLDAGTARLILIAFSDAGFYIFLAAILGLLPLLFPSGRTPSRRWRWVARVLIVGMAVAFALSLFTPKLCQAQVAESTSSASSTEGCVANPIGIPGLPPAELVVFVVLLPMLLASIAALVVRYRRSRGVERLQLKWLTFSTGALIADILVVELLLVEVLGFRGPLLTSSIFGIFTTMVPISIAVAILRYRLYEIDRIINRTVVYVLLTAIVAGIYTASISLSQRILAATGKKSDAAIVLTTLIVVTASTPIKNALQVRVDRRFKGGHDPKAPLAELPSLLAVRLWPVDPDASLRRLLDVSVGALGASGGSVSLAGRSIAQVGGGKAGAPLIASAGEGAAHIAITIEGRSSGEPYTDDDRRTLEPAVAAVAHALAQ